MSRPTTLLALAILALTLATFATAQDPPTTPAGSATFKWAAPDVGAVRNEKSATDLSYEIAIKLGGEVKARGQLGRMTMKTRREQTLAVNATTGAQTKLLVAYSEWKAVNTRSGAQPQAIEMPGNGKRYVIENRTGETGSRSDVRTLDGKGVIYAEAQSIRSDNGGLGQLPGLARLFNGKTLAVGDKVVPTAEQAKEMWGDRYISASYVYAGTRDVQGVLGAVFTTKLKVTSTMPNNSVLTFDYSGEIILMADTLWPLSIELTGPVSVGGEADHPQGRIMFEGTGKASTTSHFTYGADEVPTDKGVTMEPGTAHTPSVHDFTVKTIDGKEQKLSDYKGKVLLIVNTASKCGYTPQYQGLEALYNRYKEDGLVVLGFPCNDFGGQEPGTEADIKNFCTSTYKVTFPMFSKVSVKEGADQAKLYAFLGESAGGLPQWNFFKYLVDKDGNVRALWDARVTPDSPNVATAIEQMIKGEDDGE